MPMTGSLCTHSGRQPLTLHPAWFATVRAALRLHTEGMHLVGETARGEAAQRVAGRDGRAPGPQAHASGALRRHSWDGRSLCLAGMSSTAEGCHTKRDAGPAACTRKGRAKQDMMLSEVEASQADSHDIHHVTTPAGGAEPSA